MTAPTAEAFLSTPDPNEDELDELESLHSDPLESIAQSLWVIAGAVTEGGLTAVDETKQALDQLDAEYAELERLHDIKQQLIEDTLKICKKSTSKLADNVRALLEAPIPMAEPEDEEPFEGAGPPAHDADVEQWRAYAKSEIRPDHEQYELIDQYNRAQIRTLLGLSQTQAGA